MIAVALALTLTSSSFAPNARIPTRIAAPPCGGENRSPELRWSDAPARTRSFAIVMHDPDAPRAGGFTHWVLYDLPASTTSLAENAALPAGERGTNDTGAIGYFGPCPPPGKAHRYRITLYALDVAHVRARHPLTESELLARIAGHVLAQRTLVGRFATVRPPRSRER